MNRLAAALAHKPGDYSRCPVCHVVKHVDDFLPSFARCRECSRVMAAQYRGRNPMAVRLQHLKRINQELAAGPFMTPQQWEYLLWLADYACLCCGRTDRLYPDHIVPVSRGGPNHMSNRQPLCRRCNSRKGTKTIDYRDSRFAHLIQEIPLKAA